MDNFYKRPSYFSYVLIALISAVIGSMLSLALVPKILGTTTVAAAQSVKTLQQLTTTAQPVSTTATTPSPFQTVNIAKEVGPAIVEVANFQSGNRFGNSGLQEIGTGSGIIIDANKGYIVTNNHVISGANKIVVSLANGKSYTAKLVGADDRTDLAVLQLPNVKGLVAAPIGDSKTLQVGDPVVAIGNPGGEEFARSVTEGVISALNRELQLNGEDSFNLIQTDAAINPGNSGGALVNWQGQVIGINSAKYQQQGFEGMGFAIPISDAWPIITQLIQTGHAVHAGIFVTIDANYNQAYAQAQGYPAGALIDSVSAGGPAAKAGVQAGDIITAVNGKAITDYYGLTHELFKYPAGDTVKLTINRNGKTLTLNVTLENLPAGQ